MDPQRKRQLKAAGKAEVKRRSTALYAALDAANPVKPGDPGWSDNYKEGVARKHWLNRKLPTLWRAQWEPLFVVLPYEVNRWTPHVGGYIQCHGCGTVAPEALPWRAFYWTRCECGNVRWRCVLGWRRMRVRDARSLVPVKLIGRGSIAGEQPGEDAPL